MASPGVYPERKGKPKTRKDTPPHFGEWIFEGLGIDFKQNDSFVFYFFHMRERKYERRMKMAGIQIQKTTVASVAHQIAHYDEKTRASKTTNHRNKHIDRSKSHQNYCIGKDVSKWRDIMNKARDLVKETDKEKPPLRKNPGRVTMGVYDIFCPNEISDDKAFFDRVYEEIDKAFPNSLMGMQVHVDEQHEYVDPRKKEIRMSMKHAHCFQVPNDPVKGINGKAFFNKEWFKKMNEICRDVAKEFGAKYHTGEGHIDYGGMTQEQLKIESAKAAAEMAEAEQTKLDNIQTSIEEESEFLENLRTNENSIIERITNAIKGFMEQVSRKSRIEAKIAPKRREFVFGKANSIIERGNKELSSVYAKIGKENVGETIDSITLDLDKELTKIETEEGATLKDFMEEWER